MPKGYSREICETESEKIVKEYISDPESYKYNEFCLNHRLTTTAFMTKVRYVRDNNTSLYLKYITIDEKNRLKRFNQMENNLRQITSGILTGKCINGADFTIYDFYKLAPFKFAKFDTEIKNMINDAKKIKEIPNLEEFKYIKSSYYKQGIMDFTYAQDLIILAKTLLRLERLSEVEVNALVDYIKDNNIRNVTPLCERAFIDACASNVIFDSDDSRKTFELMDLMGYPKIVEVYNLLKDEKIRDR